MQQQFDELGRDLMRRRNQGLIDETAPADAVPERHGADPWREPKQKASHDTSIHFISSRS